MKTTIQRLAILASVLVVPAVAHAQNGCVTSPECPTAILGIVGTAGAALYARFRK